MDILMNPIVVSVIVMSVICLLKMNVLLAVIVAASRYNRRDVY